MSSTSNDGTLHTKLSLDQFSPISSSYANGVQPYALMHTLFLDS